MEINGRKIGDGYRPYVVADIGINHGGNVFTAAEFIEDLVNVDLLGAVKFQTHIPDEEMIKNEVVPDNADISIWDMMNNCALTEEQECYLFAYANVLGMTAFSTPFSLAAVDRLERLGVPAYKIGSGEVSNYTLVDYIAQQGKPVIMSCGMHDWDDIDGAVEILRHYLHPGQFALLHCTSKYPTPIHDTRLQLISEFRERYPDAVIGYSDHCQVETAAIASVSYGASIIERHYTMDRTEGPDVPVSSNRMGMNRLIYMANDVFLAGQPVKDKVLTGEKQTAKFAFSSVVSTQDIRLGEKLTPMNVTAKRPAGPISGRDLEKVHHRTAAMFIPANTQIDWNMIDGTGL